MAVLREIGMGLVLGAQRKATPPFQDAVVGRFVADSDGSGNRVFHGRHGADRYILAPLVQGGAGTGLRGWCRGPLQTCAAGAGEWPLQSRAVGAEGGWQRAWQPPVTESDGFFAARLRRREDAA